jgi:hypothetical protein
MAGSGSMFAATTMGTKNKSCGLKLKFYNWRAGNHLDSGRVKWPRTRTLLVRPVAGPGPHNLGLDSLGGHSY